MTIVVIGALRVKYCNDVEIRKISNILVEKNTLYQELLVIVHS